MMTTTRDYITRLFVCLFACCYDLHLVRQEQHQQHIYIYIYICLDYIYYLGCASLDRIPAIISRIRDAEALSCMYSDRAFESMRGFPFLGSNLEGGQQAWVKNLRSVLGTISVRVLFCDFLFFPFHQRWMIQQREDCRQRRRCC